MTVIVDTLVVYRTAHDPDDPAAIWLPIASKDVPRAIKHRDVMGRMMAGEVAQTPGDPYWYRAEKYEAKG